MEPLDISKEIGSSQWIDTLGFQLAVTKAHFQENLRKFTDDISCLQKRQAPIRHLRAKLTEFGANDPAKIVEVEKLFEECKNLETQLQEFESAPKDWEKEGKSQILFTHELTKPLNHIPFLLPAAAIFKIYIFPFFAVVLPLLAWILPYVLVRFFFGMNIPFDHYKNMMLNMWLGGKPWASLDFWGQMRVVFQTAWTLFGIFQGMYQPIQQARHTKAIDDTIVKHGKLFQLFVQKVEGLLSLLGEIKGKEIHCIFIKDIPMDEPRQTYAYVRDYPKDVTWIWQKLAEEEVEWRLAGAIHLNLATYTTGPVSLEMKEFFDPTISPLECVSSTISLGGKKSHALLTGPNKGGKSSTLRALCLNIWFAQTFGLVFAKEAILTPFAWIRSGLRLADLPGSESLFEREIHFATKTLRKAHSGQRGFVLYDECFHSTNPPDGERTAKHFLQELWKARNVVSLVSTHVFSLVDEAPPEIERLCVPAEKTAKGLHYSFCLAPGVCKVSSVEEIYKKFGFPPTAAKRKSETGLPG